MAFFFPAPFADQVAFFHRSVARLKAGGVWASADLHDTILALLAVEVAIHREGPAPATVEQFRREAVVALAPLAAQVRNFVESVADEAETVDADAWEELCGRRSAIEILRTRYAGTPGVADIDPGDVHRLDDAMRHAGRDLGPTRPDFRLPGIPVSHWWWWCPDAPPAASVASPMP